MAFCQNCGQKLNDGAKFCPECGNPVAQASESKRQTVFGGKIVKCPNCGETLNSFTTTCTACGYELRGASSVSVVKEFEAELKQIEAGRKSDKGTGIGKAFAKAFGANTTNPVDQQLANRIANFTVPNTQEDVFEFMILAASNIDPMAYDTSDNGYALAEREGKLMVSNAWDSKYNQVYQKAKMMFPTDPRLVEIENLYKRKQKQIKGTKSKSLLIVLGCIALYALLMFALFAMGSGTDRKIDKLDAQLNQTVAEIQVDISNGDYDEALIKANTLHFNSSLSESRAEDWDEQREALIKLIEQKKSEGGN